MLTHNQWLWQRTSGRAGQPQYPYLQVTQKQPENVLPKVSDSFEAGQLLGGPQSCRLRFVSWSV
jgi:hypothetical protein